MRKKLHAVLDLLDQTLDHKNYAIKSYLDQDFDVYYTPKDLEEQIETTRSEEELNLDSFVYFYDNEIEFDSSDAFFLHFQPRHFEIVKGHWQADEFKEA